MKYSFLIDTSSPESYLSLIGDGQLLSKKQWKSDRTLSNKLLQGIDEFLKEKEIMLSHVSRYGVQVGPGHFSALRTGVVVATMLSYAHKADVVPIKSRDLNDQIKELQNTEPVDKLELVYE